MYGCRDICLSAPPFRHPSDCLPLSWCYQVKEKWVTVKDIHMYANKPKIYWHTYVFLPSEVARFLVVRKHMYANKIILAHMCMPITTSFFEIWTIKSLYEWVSRKSAVQWYNTFIALQWNTSKVEFFIENQFKLTTACWVVTITGSDFLTHWTRYVEV